MFSPPGMRLEPTGHNPRRYTVSFDDLEDGVQRLVGCPHQASLSASLPRCRPGCRPRSQKVGVPIRPTGGARVIASEPASATRVTVPSAVIANAQLDTEQLAPGMAPTACSRPNMMTHPGALLCRAPGEATLMTGQYLLASKTSANAMAATISGH